jgi:hypothetical membrane protein
MAEAQGKSWAGGAKHARAELLAVTGAAGLAGPLLFTIGILVLGQAIPGHDPVRHTISDLGRGPHAIWGDTLFYLNAGGMVALAIGAAHAHPGGRGWSAGVLCLALIAPVLVMLGLWDEFRHGSEVRDYSVHTWVSTLLLPLFLVGPAAMIRGAGGRTGRLFAAAAVLWPILALAYFFGPGDIRGLLERAAGLSTLLWTLPLGWLLLSRGWAPRR